MIRQPLVSVRRRGFDSKGENNEVGYFILAGTNPHYSFFVIKEFYETGTGSAQSPLLAGQIHFFRKRVQSKVIDEAIHVLHVNTGSVPAIIFDMAFRVRTSVIFSKLNFSAFIFF